MKENALKGIFATAIAGLTAYAGELLIPVIVLGAVMLADYISGIGKAWATKQLNSRIGLIGIIKKLGYLLVVCVGMGVDWIVDVALKEVGIPFEMPFVFALLVIVWLIINELISILENLGEIGVPLPPWLKKVVGKLKNGVEAKVQIGDDESVSKENGVFFDVENTEKLEDETEEAKEPAQTTFNDEDVRGEVENDAGL